jgi:hypothetical protein
MPILLVTTDQIFTTIICRKYELNACQSGHFDDAVEAVSCNESFSVVLENSLFLVDASTRRGDVMQAGIAPKALFFGVLESFHGLAVNDAGKGEDGIKKL